MPAAATSMGSRHGNGQQFAAEKRKSLATPKSREAFCGEDDGNRTRNIQIDSLVL
jgi:hypothetical protein